MKTKKIIVSGILAAMVLVPSFPAFAAESCEVPPCETKKSKAGSATLERRIFNISGIKVEKSNDPVYKSLVRKLYDLLILQSELRLKERKAGK